MKPGRIGGGVRCEGGGIRCDSGGIYPSEGSLIQNGGGKEGSLILYILNLLID